MALSRMVRTVGVIVGLGVGAAMAEDTKARADHAHDTCGPHRSTILHLADRVLAERGLAKRFSERHFGTAAAYLKLRYGNMDFAAGMDLLEHARGSARRGPRDLDSVRLAFAVSEQGVDRGLRADGRTAAEIFADVSPVVMRQILLADAGESFLRLLATVRTDPDLVEGFESRYLRGASVHLWILDQSDDFKLRLARNAEAAGELVLAAMVLGSRRDLSAYHALLERHRDTDVDALAGPSRLASHLATLLHQTAAISVKGDDPERRILREREFEIMRAAFRMGGMAWLGILYNQTGADVPIAQASRDFLAEGDAGKLDPDTELEEAWAYLYDRLAQEMGADDLSRSMAGFTLRRSVRHYADRAQVTLDWINARQALIPYLTGLDQVLPPRPARLTPEFDWTAWTRLATALTEGAVVLPPGGDPKIALELMLAKGDVARALDFAQNALPDTDRLWFYRDVMIRLDRHCDGYTLYPGAELVMAGDIFYRFD